jgi:hypothetical protein
VDGLTDVSTGTPTSLSQLVYSSSRGQWIASVISGGSGITAIASASDVSVSAVVDGQFLIYNSVAGEWQNVSRDYPTSTQVSTMISAALSTYITSASVSAALTALGSGDFVLIAIVTISNTTTFSIVFPAGGYSEIQFLAPAIKVSATTLPNLFLSYQNTAGVTYNTAWAGFGFNFGAGIATHDVSSQFAGTNVDFLGTRASVGSFPLFMKIHVYNPFSDTPSSQKRTTGILGQQLASSEGLFLNFYGTNNTTGLINQITFQSSTGFVAASSGVIYVYGLKDS